MIPLLFTVSQSLLTNSVAEYLRGILTGAFLGCTLFAFKAVGNTNVLLIASPKVCRFFEYIPNAFFDAEGPTDIEVALIRVNIPHETEPSDI